MFIWWGSGEGLWAGSLWRPVSSLACLHAGIVLTNDGHAILREIDVTHPAAKVGDAETCIVGHAWATCSTRWTGAACCRCPAAGLPENIITVYHMCLRVCVLAVHDPAEPDTGRGGGGWHHLRHHPG